MKSIRNIAFSALLTFAAFSTVTYTSCNQDECKDVVCNNGGTCKEDDGSCVCPTGYEGSSCETLTRSKFIGTWTGSDVCGAGNYNVTLAVKPSSNDVQALIENPGGFGNSVTITGVVTANNKLSFTNQSVGGGRTLNGTMTFDDKSMTFTYTVAGTSDTDNCTGSYSKQ